MLPDPPDLRENSLNQNFGPINRSKTLIKAVFAQNRWIGHNKERSPKRHCYQVLTGNKCARALFKYTNSHTFYFS